MLYSICPKLPMRNKLATVQYYVHQLGFSIIADFEKYLIVQKDAIEIHFFEFTTLIPSENYGQVYIRTQNIDGFYSDLQTKNVAIHPNGHLEKKPWGQIEFSLLDPDNNLLTFGESIV